MLEIGIIVFSPLIVSIIMQLIDCAIDRKSPQSGIVKSL